MKPLKTKVYRDADGDLWISNPDGLLQRFDFPVVRAALTMKWPPRTRSSVEAEVGELRELS